MHCITAESCLQSQPSCSSRGNMCCINQGFSKVLEATKERAPLLYWQKLQRKPESEGALMDYITHAPEMDLPASLNEVDAYSVYAAFATR